MGFDSIGNILRQKIIDLHNKGTRQSEISSTLGVKKYTVSRLIKNFKEKGTFLVNHKGGRPRSTSPRDDQLIARYIKKYPFKSAVSVQKETNISVSPRTIGRRLQEAGLFSRRPAKKPLISKKNRAKRLHFAQEHVGWSVSKWKSVLFSDESKFNMFGSDGNHRVWRPVKKRLNERYCQKTVKHGGGHVMVWGCFSGKGLGPIHRIEGIMDRFMYRDIMENVMLPYAEWQMPLKWIYQQDNDPKHTSVVVKNWFHEHQVTVLDWPPQSPDLNPIENLWEIIDQKINRDDIRTKDQLFDQLKKAWTEIPKDVVTNLIESMPRRCKAVIESQGFATKY